MGGVCFLCAYLLAGDGHVIVDYPLHALNQTGVAVALDESDRQAMSRHCTGKYCSGVQIQQASKPIIISYFLRAPPHSIQRSLLPTLALSFLCSVFHSSKTSSRNSFSAH